jgi:hypothetical protein
MAAFCLTDLIDWRYIHTLMVCIFYPACERLLPWTKELYLCIGAPLLYLLSDLLPPPQTKCTVYTDSVWLWGWGGWGVLNCTVDHILQEFYTLFLTRFRTYKMDSPPQAKMTSKDDIKGLVSLKFLRPWTIPSTQSQVGSHPLSPLFCTG